MEIAEINFGSVCSGIEAASVAWEPLGWRAAWLSEIEPFPCSVLAHHWPHVPNLGDMTTIKGRIRAGEIDAPAVFTGGTPCQAFSVAGKRGSLSDERGNLSLEFCEIADAIDDIRRDRGEQPSVIVWENVPGVLSTGDNAFGCFLAGLAGDDQPLEPGPRPEHGRSSAHWTWKKDAGEHVPKWPDAGVTSGPSRTVAWRVLDAQYFGLAQRRRRVFVVASARYEFDPAAVLFEFEGVRRDSPPSREPREGVAGTLDARTSGGGFPGTDGAIGGHIQPAIAFGGGRTSGPVDVAACLVAAGQKLDFEVETFCVHGTQDPDIRYDQAHTLGRNSGQENAVLGIYENQRSELRLNDVIGTIQCAGGKPGQGYPATLVGMRVRRLTPVECERLQGFNDNHTLVPHRGKPAADGPRYKALGNSWAVNCARWIGYRIAKQC